MKRLIKKIAPLLLGISLLLNNRVDAQRITTLDNILDSITLVNPSLNAYDA